MDKGIQGKITKANAKCGYYLHKDIQKRILGIHYVDDSNLQEVIKILPFINIPYSIGISHATLNQSLIIELSQNHNMTALALIDCQYSPDINILEYLKSNRNLQELGLSFRNSDIDLSINFLTAFSQISILRITATNRISNKDFECITNLHLLNLDMTASHISTSQISTIVKCNFLKYLSLSQCRFENTNDIKQLVKIKSLEILDLSMCDIDKTIFDSFIGNSTLKKIIVNGTKCTEKDLELIDSKLKGFPAVIGTPVLVQGNCGEKD
jgi:hypothetical protein